MDDNARPPNAAEAPDPNPAGGRIARVRIAAGKLIGVTAIGGSGGTLGGLVTLLGDRSGQSLIKSIQWGVFLGGLGGLFKVIHDGPWAWFKEYRTDEHRQAKLDAERRAADAERKVAEWEGRYEQLMRRFDKLESDHGELRSEHREMSNRLDRMRDDYDASIAKAEERYSRLWERYELDRDSKLRSDQPPA